MGSGGGTLFEQHGPPQRVSWVLFSDFEPCFSSLWISIPFYFHVFDFAHPSFVSPFCLGFPLPSCVPPPISLIPHFLHFLSDFCLEQPTTKSFQIPIEVSTKTAFVSEFKFQHHLCQPATKRTQNNGFMLLKSKILSSLQFVEEIKIIFSCDYLVLMSDWRSRCVLKVKYRTLLFCKDAMCRKSCLHVWVTNF